MNSIPNHVILSRANPVNPSGANPVSANPVILRSGAKDPYPGRSLLIALLLIGLALRLGIVFAFHDFESPPTWEYGATASNLAAGKGYSGGGWLGPEGPTALNSPGYIVFLAAALRLFGPHAYVVVELAQAVLSAVMPLIVYRIAGLLFDRRIAVLSFALAALYPPYLYFPKQITPAIATAFATGLAVLLVLELRRRRSAPFAALCGLVIGLAILTEGLALLVVIGLALLWRRSIAQRSLAIATTVALLTILPWTWRNYVVFDAFVPLKTSFGLNLWLGNNPHATGTIFTSDGRYMPDVIEPDQARALAEMNEAKRYETLQREAFAWIIANPQRFLELSARRLVYYWWGSPLADLAPEMLSSPVLLYQVQLILHVPFLALGLLGIYAAFRANRATTAPAVVPSSRKGIWAWFPSNREAILGLLWWLLSYTLVYAATLPNARRVRLPAELPLIIFAACALMLLWRLCGSRNLSKISLIMIR